MPWLALPFDAKERRDELSLRFGVPHIPHLVILEVRWGTPQTPSRHAFSDRHRL